MRENALTRIDISRIVVHCSEMAHRHCAWPYRPAGVTAAQMNMPFALAMMAVDRAAMGAQFREERLEDPNVLPMLDRIRVEPAEEYSKGGDETRHAARVLVETRSGKTSFARDLEPAGKPGQSDDGSAACRRNSPVLAGAALSAAQIAALSDAIRQLDALPASALRELLTPQPGR